MGRRYFLLLCGSLLWVPLLAQADGEANRKGSEVTVVGCNLTTEQAVSDDGLSIKASVDSSSYKIGDSLTLEVTPSADAYITVIDQGSNPDVPERGHELFTNTFVVGGNTYTFPPPHSGRLKVSGHTGSNTFEVIAALSPIDPPDAAEAGKTAKKRDVNLEPDEKPKDLVGDTRCTLSFEITDK